MSALPALRLNGRSYELIVRRARARTSVEVRRKQDGELIASGAGRGAVALTAHVAARSEVGRALRELGSRAAGLGLRLTARATRSAPRARRASPLATTILAAVPVDYGTRRGLARMREPRVLRSVGRDRYGREQFLAPCAARAWLRMRQAAQADGVVLELVSAFRSAAYQAALLARKVAAGRTLAQVLEVNAAPGYSEHHAGRAIDVATPGSQPLEEAFETTDAFRWLCANAGAFGFALSFPRDNPHGIAYEPWHWCWSRR